MPTSTSRRTPTDLRRSAITSASESTSSGRSLRPPNVPHAPFPHTPSLPRTGSRTGSREMARDAAAEQCAHSFGALSTLVGPAAPPLRHMNFPPPPRTPDAALDDGSRPLTSGQAPPTGLSGRPQSGLPQAGAVAAIISCRFDPSSASCPSHPPPTALGTTLGTTLSQAAWPPPLGSLLGQARTACAIATPGRGAGAVLGTATHTVPVLGSSSSAGTILGRPWTGGAFPHESRAAEAKKTPFYALSADQQRQHLRKEWLAHGDTSPAEPLPKVSASVRPLPVTSAVPSSSWAARQPTVAHSSAPSAAAPLTVRRLPVGLAKSLPRPAVEALEAFRELQGGDAAPRARLHLPKRSGSPLGVELYVATNLHGRQLAHCK